MLSEDIEEIRKALQELSTDDDVVSTFMALTELWLELESKCREDHVKPKFKEAVRIIIEWLGQTNDLRHGEITSHHVGFAASLAERRIHDGREADGASKKDRLQEQTH